jgi:hypothetical protein
MCDREVGKALRGVPPSPDVRCRTLTGPDSMPGVVAGEPAGGGRTLIDCVGAYCGDMDNERAFLVIRQTVLA